jgi:cell division protease FtsH
MGHALVGLTLPDTEPVQKISIIPRGIGALGYTLRRPTEDRYLMTRQELLNKMTVLMGGRAAELIVFKEISTGAADDFAKATEIARNMVTRYGMVEDVGMVSYMEEYSPFLSDGLSAGAHAHLISEKTKKEMDTAVKELIQGAFDRAVMILKEKRDDLEHGATLLLKQETISEDEIKTLLSEPDRAKTRKPDSVLK